METKLFRPTARYQRRLENYLEWARCTTPMDGISSPALIKDGPLEIVGTPEEAIFLQETFGRNAICLQEGLTVLLERLCKHTIEPFLHPLFLRYARGKANRDWWSKEKGWWDHNALYVPEEFLCHLTDKCFEELFEPRPLRVHMARYWFDGNYSYEDFVKYSSLYLTYGLEQVAGGLRIAIERDYGQNQCTYWKGQDFSSDQKMPTLR